MFRDRIKKMFGQRDLENGKGPENEIIYDNIVSLYVNYGVHGYVVLRNRAGGKFTLKLVEKIDMANDLSNRIVSFTADDDGVSLKFIDSIDALYDTDDSILWLGPKGIFHEYGD